MLLLPWRRTLPRLARAMSTVTVSPAMAILDKLIDHVSHLPATTTSAPHASHSSSSSSTPSTTASYLPSHTTDIAWRPIVPIGHTKYTWVGDDDTSTAASNTHTASSSSAASPSASAITDAAAPRPDAAAAASAALPVPHAAAPKPAKEKKAAAQPVKGKKEEPVKTDQPDISRLDIRVGQVVRAWKHPEGTLLPPHLLQLWSAAGA